MNQLSPEFLQLGSPAAGEVVITVDAAAAGAPFAAGTQTLKPGAAIPIQRHLDRDMALFIHKGQGRATLDGRATIVNPGAMWSVPRGTWYGLRNPGNGDLQLAWVSSPGIEAWFRDLANAGALPSADALQELAQRHRVEFQPGAETPAAPRPRGRRGGRRHRGAGHPAAPPASSGAPAPLPAAGVEVPAASAGGAPQQPYGLRRRRRRRGGSGQRPATTAGAHEQRPQAGRAPAHPPRASAPGAGRQGPGRPQRPGRGRHQRRGKEVFMGGQWVRVDGEGPAIAPKSRPKRGDDDEPGVRLSVPL